MGVESNEPFIARAEKLARDCELAASLIRQQSAAVARSRKIVQVGAVGLGVFGAASNLPVIARAITATGTEIASLATALGLLGSVIYYASIGSDTPERYIDHGQYIGSYPHRLREVLWTKEGDPAAQSARLQELIRLAEWNLNDAKDKWPWLEARLNTSSSSV